MPAQKQTIEQEIEIELIYVQSLIEKWRIKCQHFDFHAKAEYQLQLSKLTDYRNSSLKKLERLRSEGQSS